MLVEAPTYDRPLKILARLGADVVALPMDDEGLDPDALERELAAGETSFLYTIPTFQNPSGRTLSTERRRRVVELAQAHGVPVLEDDPYGLVRYEGEAPPSLFDLEGGTLVTYASSFSKTVAPGLRVGWFVAPAELAARIEARAVSTYISPPFLTQATVHELMTRGAFEPNLERIRGLLKARRDAMLGALERELGGGDATWSEPDGGYFLWVDLPGDAAGLLARAEAAGVTFVKGSDFFPNGGGEQSARLAFSYASPSEIDSGVSTLACAPARLTASVQLREQHAADEPGEQREQDHPDQRRPRLAEDEVDGRLFGVADDERDQVGRDQDQQAERDPEPRLPAALELVAGRLAATPWAETLRGGEARCMRRQRHETRLPGRPESTLGEADASGTACRRAGRTTRLPEVAVLRSLLQ